jgi:exodeoxyribonuclease VII large subunit
MSTVLSVSELTRAISDTLAAEIGSVQVEGEIASFTAARSGHWYLDLKDERALLSCVMFRGSNQYVRPMPQPGDRVVVTGRLDVYAPRGRYNLVIRKIARAGDGDLQARLDALKRKLHAEGLFDPARKRPLPALPRAIGVATSATGAAFHDILKVLGRRFPGASVFLAPCRVQGEHAPAEVVAAIELLNAHAQADVLIVGRGGGSPEDLMAFNHEAVARAIAGSHIPVVSAVGHEVDVSIADLVADVRAATPSHAAELVVPEREGLLLLLDDLDGRMRASMDRSIRRRRERLARLVVRHPGRGLAEARVRVVDLRQRLGFAWARDGVRRRAQVDATRGRLEALSPVAVLGRGYAVAFKDGQAIRDAGALESGDVLELRLHVGRTRVRVEDGLEDSADVG